MFRFIRTATVKNSAMFPQATGFAREIAGYMSKTFDIDLKVGIEMFGPLCLHWMADFDHLADIEMLNQKLMGDTTYWAMLENNSAFWVDGTLNDAVIHMG